MAIFHLRMKKSKRGNRYIPPAAHLDYINRDEKYGKKKDLVFKEVRNLPEDFNDIKDFWKCVEQNERKNPEKGGWKKENRWTKKDRLKELRKDWETILNFQLEKKGFEKVSSKSLADQKRDAENNKDYEKIYKLDRDPINIPGEILYKRETDLTDKERNEKRIFEKNRTLRNGTKLMESVKNYPNSYEYASSNLQKNEEIVIEVLKRNEDALNYGDENIKKEIEEIKERYKDSDLDGLTDREEKFIYYTNPYSKDTDLDGRTDYEEIKIDYTNAKIPDRNKKQQDLER